MPVPIYGKTVRNRNPQRTGLRPVSTGSQAQKIINYVSELISKEPNLQRCKQKVKLVFIRLRKSKDNAYIESFDRDLRYKCLSTDGPFFPKSP